jgi:multisubunit Na+/H+ antiporter MnhE subunit
MSIRTGIAILSRLVAFFAIYLLLADTVETQELITGAVAGVLAAGLTTLLDNFRSVNARVRPSMLRYAYRPFVALVTDSAPAAWALVQLLVLRRPVRGRFRVARYTTTGDDEEDAARRMLTEWGGSLGANRYVIGIDPEREQLIVHEMVPAAGPLDPLELG